MNCYCKTNDIIKCIGIFTSIIVIIILIIGIVMCNSNNQKDILTTIAVEGDNTEQGTTTIKFSQNDIVVGTALSHQEGTDTISINETGIYQISYQLFGIRNASGSFNFNCVLLVNGTAIDSTFNDGPVLEDIVNNRYTLTSTVILKLNAGDTLKLLGVSFEDINYEKARMDIEKID